MSEALIPSRRRFLEVAVGLILSPKLDVAGAPACAVSLATKPAIESFEYSLCTNHINAIGAYSPRAISEKIAIASGNSAELAKLKHAISQHGYVMDNRLKSHFHNERKGRIIIEALNDPQAEEKYNSYRADVLSSGAAEEDIPTWNEFKNIFEREFSKPVGFYKIKAEKALSYAEREISKTQKPLFADMASSRKAMTHPITRCFERATHPDLANGVRDIILKNAYLNNHKMLFDDTSGCESMRGR